MADTDVVRLPEPRANIKLPELIDLDMDEGMPPHSPRELSMLRASTGKGFQDLIGPDALDEDRERVLIWFKLRRLGYEPTWEEAEEVLINYVQPNPPKDGD